MIGLAVVMMTVGAAPVSQPTSGQIELIWRLDGTSHREMLTLSTLPQVELVRADLQYDRQVRVKGVALASLIERLPGEGDLVLAHFSNGMIVPLPDAKGMVRLAPFVATSLWVEDEPGSGSWQALPPVSKKGSVGTDVRPIRFDGNKLVISERWHPAVPSKAQAVFSPWEHTNALTRLERVTQTAFAAQFVQGATPLEITGRTVFEQRCRFCHGARRQGATFGWDFVEPVPLHSYRSPSSLFMHVRYREGDAPEKGLMMPQLSDLTRDDAKALWEWMRRLSENVPPSKNAPPR
jgi:cytochrome c5